MAAAAPKVRVRPMGKQGMMASMQGYGCMGLTAFYGKPVSDEEGIAVLQRAFDLGVTHFDTAEIYKAEVDGVPKFNEELVGKFAAKVGRDKITIATKYMPTASVAEKPVRDTLEASLKRLDMPCVDLYYLHRIPGDGGLDAWMEGAKQMVAEGKCKYLGLSEATADEIRRAHAIHPLTAVQSEYSLLIRGIEDSILPTCRELGIATVAYSPLCRGFATAQVKKAEDWSKIGNAGGAASGFQAICPHLNGENLEKNASLLAPLEAAAAKAGATPSQLSLAWVQAQGEDVFPIPGTTKPANLESNVAACDVLFKLGKEVFEGLGKDVDHKALAGTRYPEAMMARLPEGKS